jgi:hypothetical protein
MMSSFVAAADEEGVDEAAADVAESPPYCPPYCPSDATPGAAAVRGAIACTALSMRLSRACLMAATSIEAGRRVRARSGRSCTPALVACGAKKSRSSSTTALTSTTSRERRSSPA